MNLIEKLKQNAASGDSCQGVSEDMFAAAQRIENLEAALKELIADEWRMSADWGASDERQEILARVAAVLANAKISGKESRQDA